MINNLGYACICLSLPQKGKDLVSTSRTIRQATFLKDKSVVDEICLKNCQDLEKILRWNVDNNINYFRVGSNFFPFMDHPTLGYKLEDTKYFKQISETLERCGMLSRLYSMRLSCHPGQYCCIGSSNPSVVNASLQCLEMHSQIGDLLGCGDEFKINIHVNSFKEGYDIIADRFCKNFDRLSDRCKRRLTVENDDKKDGWSVNLLYEKVYKNISTPICFDYHHFQFCNGGESYVEAAEKCFSTWGNESPETHYSESRDNIRPTAHSDYIKNIIPEFSKNYVYDVMIEAKQKDLALLAYRELI